jgi:two-component system LytT family response regulator
MRVLIVDDERLARVRLRALLAAHPDARIVAEADSVIAARAALAAHAIDVVFLDITMPGGSGFDLIDGEPLEAQVVFVTAHDAHALRAFERGAVDYLVKPIEAARLATTLRRLHARPGARHDRICVRSEGSVRVLAITELVLVRVEDDYSEVLLRDGSTVVTRVALSGWERRLGQDFVRVSRSTIVAVAAVTRIERAEGSTFRLVLSEPAAVISVSRSRIAAVRASLRRRDG